MAGRGAYSILPAVCACLAAAGARQTASGLVFKELAAGSGPKPTVTPFPLAASRAASLAGATLTRLLPQITDTVRVHYEGALVDVRSPRPLARSPLARHVATWAETMTDGGALAGHDLRLLARARRADQLRADRCHQGLDGGAVPADHLSPLAPPPCFVAPCPRPRLSGPSSCAAVAPASCRRLCSSCRSAARRSSPSRASSATARGARRAGASPLPLLRRACLFPSCRARSPLVSECPSQIGCISAASFKRTQSRAQEEEPTLRAASCVLCGRSIPPNATLVFQVELLAIKPA